MPFRRNLAVQLPQRAVKIHSPKWSGVDIQLGIHRQAFEDAGTESSVTDQYYRNDVFSERPYTRHIRSLRFTCKKRGFYRINGLDVVAGDLFLTHELPKSSQLSPRTVLLREKARDTNSSSSQCFAYHTD